jgi:hypothetical protein
MLQAKKIIAEPQIPGKKATFLPNINVKNVATVEIA